MPLTPPERSSCDLELILWWLNEASEPAFGTLAKSLMGEGGLYFSSPFPKDSSSADCFLAPLLFFSEFITSDVYFQLVVNSC